MQRKCCRKGAIAYIDSSLIHRLVLCALFSADNGGDGLVCARHLAQFGYELTVEYPQEAKKELYKASHTAHNSELLFMRFLGLYGVAHAPHCL